MQRILFALFLIILPTNSRANVIGPDIQNFNPTSGGVDFLTVHSSETLDPGVFNVGLFANHAVNSLPYFEEGGSLQNRDRYNDALLMGDLNIGLGVLPNLELGFSYPRLINQSIRSDAARGQFGVPGNTELRFMTKYRIKGRKNGGAALVLSTNINRISNNPYIGKKNNPIINFEVVGDTKVLGAAIGGNIGYRFRNPGEPIEGSAIKPVEDQVVASAAVSYLLTAIDTKIISEIFGSRPVQSNKSATDNRQASSLELIMGLKYDLTRRTALHFGVGTELISGAASPDWRAYAGINFSNIVFKKKNRGKVKIAKKKIEQVEDPLEIPPVKGETVIVLDDIQFEFDSYDEFLPGAKETIKRLVNYLNKPPVFKSLLIVGHTDSVGSDEYNLLLSIRRAWKIRNILVQEYNIDQVKISTEGFGKTKPVADNGNYQGRQENRRVEFHIDR